MFTKILIPVDGSKHSVKALACGSMLAKKFRSKIVLVHVYQIPLTVTPAISSTIVMPIVMDAARKAGERILKKSVVQIQKTKTNRELAVTAHLKEGDTVKEIINAAKQEKANLIVMGARGVSKLEAVFLGSVSDGVIRKAHCPVIVTR
ncbi:MAG: universal stress protein [Candidatus Bathyarchaeota archaeon]